jgi:hypothetical protein
LDIDFLLSYLPCPAQAAKPICGKACGFAYRAAPAQAAKLSSRLFAILAHD